MVVCGTYCIFCPRSDKVEIEQAEKAKIAAAERKRCTWLTSMANMKSNIGNQKNRPFNEGARTNLKSLRLGRLADDFDQQHREAKKEWTAAKEASR